MKKIIFALFLSVGTFTFVNAQSDVTTFVLVRHADKADDGTKDPDLAAEGKQRAERLAQLLSQQKIDAAMSTDFKRTQQTAGPLVAKQGLTLTKYKNLTDAAMDSLATKYKGATVLIVGHSNTVPTMANHLLNEQKFKMFDDKDYGNVLVITVANPGEAGNVLHLSY
jgi:broad specificity phosphatase PhoE